MAKLSDYVQRWGLKRAGRNIDFPAAGESMLQSAVVSLSSEQILALYDTPAEIVAAPGDGKSIVIVDAFAQIVAGTPYTGETELDLTFPGLVDNNYSDLQFYFSDVLASADDTVTRAHYAPSPALNTADVDNQPLVLHHENSNPADGDGTVTITVYYVVMELA